MPDDIDTRVSELLKEFRLVKALDGEVREIMETDKKARIAFKTDDGSLVRVFPLERLQKADAAFPTALVRYEIYESGPYSLTVMRYAGPPKEELLKQPFDRLSEEELRTLES